MTLQDKIKLAIEQGKMQGAKKLASVLLKQEHIAEFDKAMQEEYESLFPTYREPTQDEMDAQLEVYKEANPDDTSTDGFVISKVEIDYSEDETYLPYSNWINETKVITEEVQEVSHLDDNGMKVIDTPYQAEVTELVRPYTPLTITNDLINNKLLTFKQYKDYISKQKKDAINSIKITTSTGKDLYADPISRTDIADVIKCMEINDITEYNWKTVNGIMSVTLDEFKEALLLGLQKKGEIIGV